PTPDHVARSAFFLGVLQYEDGKFAEALEHFRGFADKYPAGSLAAQARLRLGFCQVKLKQYADARKTLQPLVDKDPALADQALLWIGKAHLGQADPTKPDTLKSAIESFRKSAELAGQRSSANPPDPSARTRKGEALLELAEAQQLAKQYRDAAATYN